MLEIALALSQGAFVRLKIFSPNLNILLHEPMELILSYNVAASNRVNITLRLH
jgi:hypothetical protein